MGSREAVVTAGVRSGSLTEGWSTDAAGVSVMEDVNREAAGAVSVTVHGANMGRIDDVAQCEHSPFYGLEMRLNSQRFNHPCQDWL